MVAYEGTRHSIEINIAVNTTHVPHILTFEVRTIAPAEYLYTDIVFASAYVVCHVEFSIIVCTLSITDRLTVYPYKGSAVDTIEVQEDTFAFPTFGQGEVAAV